MYNLFKQGIKRVNEWKYFFKAFEKKTLYIKGNFVYRFARILCVLDELAVSNIRRLYDLHINLSVNYLVAMHIPYVCVKQAKKLYLTVTERRVPNTVILKKVKHKDNTKFPYAITSCGSGWFLIFL